MVIFLQYTFTDYRRLNGSATNLVLKPNWPFPSPNKEFVKFSGQIVQRSKLGIDNWIGETYLCKINRGIKVAAQTPLWNKDLLIKCVGRHQFSIDNCILTKIEFVFTVKDYSFEKLITKKILSILDTIINQELSIRSFAGSYTTTTFKNCTDNLKEYYVLNTTKSGRYNIAEELKQIEACAPQIFFVLEGNERYFNTTPKFNQHAQNYIRNFYSSWKSINNKPFKIWIHERLTDSVLITINRKFRISILRLHSEFECLKNVLRFVTHNKIDMKRNGEASENLQGYLNRATRTILQDTRVLTHDYSEKDYLVEFTDIFSKLHPGELDSIREKINQLDLRRQIKVKLQNIVNNTYNVTFMEQKNDNRGAQIAAQGFFATAEGNTLNQNNFALPENMDYGELAKQLANMKTAMKEEADSDEEFMSVVEIGKAEAEAKNKNGNKAVKHLKAAGKWAGDFVSKVGASLVAEIIKRNSGIV